MIFTLSLPREEQNIIVENDGSSNLSGSNSVLLGGINGTCDLNFWLCYLEKLSFIFLQLSIYLGIIFCSQSSVDWKSKAVGYFVSFDHFSYYMIMLDTLHFQPWEHISLSLCHSPTATPPGESSLELGTTCQLLLCYGHSVGCQVTDIK